MLCDLDVTDGCKQNGTVKEYFLSARHQAQLSSTSPSIFRAMRLKQRNQLSVAVYIYIRLCPKSATVLIPEAHSHGILLGFVACMVVGRRGASPLSSRWT